MSLICGQWPFDNSKSQEMRSHVPTGGEAESTSIYSDENIWIAMKGFDSADVFVHREGSNGTAAKSTLAWNGRLDNRLELASDLGMRNGEHSRDADVAAAAYARWNTDAFRKIKGDWSLIIWDAAARSLTLSKDPVGTRPLFYSIDRHRLWWSSSLGWLVRNAGIDLTVNLEYLAGWLAFFPSAAVTPYLAIQSVPPSSFVTFFDGTAETLAYSQIEPSDLYRTWDDHECEEHFRSLFANSIRRRLRSSKPALSELSGGMDSSSIVCVADALLLREKGLAPRLDTVSYYDDDEPNWNERPYFSLVEQKRGRAGLHVPVDSAYFSAALFENREFAVVPTELGKASRREGAVSEFIAAEGHGTLLCGIGGDEFTGGVPTPVPELADLLAAGEFRQLFRQMTAWALSQKRPLAHLFLETVQAFVPRFFGPIAKKRKVPTWLTPEFGRQFGFPLRGYEKSVALWQSRPSFQENCAALTAVTRQLAVSHVESEAPAAKCYPYLDCDLLQFLFNVPRAQLIQPGRRRSLMRRSLAGIVPDAILNRKRKAFVNRAPRAAIADHWTHVESLSRNMIAESLGVVSSAAFRRELEHLRSGKNVPIVPIQRTLVIESWLRNISKWGFLPGGERLDHERRRLTSPSSARTSQATQVSAG
jgi:asparagine synthase (glutamine-hydrolysing)